MKRKIPLLAAVLMVTMLFPVSALAHGHGGRGSARAVNTLCPVEDCSLAYTHHHGSTSYSGHYFGDGHDYHALCDVSDCTLTTTHYHDGVTCYPHSRGDGHSYHNRGHRGRHH